MDRGPWLATVHGVPKSQTQLMFSLFTDRDNEVKAFENPFSASVT